MTLVELLVVLGVVAVIVGMSVPALMGYAKQLRLKTAARQTLSIISLARSLAISSHEDHAVLIDAERGEIHVSNLTSGEELEHAVRLPTSVTVTLMVGGKPSTNTQFVFRSTGALLGRTVALLLSDGQKQHTITVTGTTGSMTIQ